MGGSYSSKASDCPVAGIIRPFCLMTERHRGDVMMAIERMPHDKSWVVVRDYDHSNRAAYAAKLLKLCRDRRMPIAFGIRHEADYRLARRLAFDGVHLRKDALHLLPYLRQMHPSLTVTAGARHEGEIAPLIRQGVEAIFFSPVFATASHPTMRPLGLLRCRKVAWRYPGKIIALGGIDARSSRQLFATTKIAAIAGISLFMNETLS